jgi:hypothetical protein
VSEPVLLGDPAAVVPEDPEDHRSVAAVVPARPLDRGLRARARAVPRLHGRAVRAGDQQATETWKAEQGAFADRDLSGVDYVYLWVDGIHVNIRLQEHKLCLHALDAVAAFEAAYGAKFGKATAKITDDVEELLAFYDYPPSTGSTCAPRTRSSRPSPPCDTARRSPAGPARGRRGRRWRLSSSRLPRLVGGR